MFRSIASAALRVSSKGSSPFLGTQHYAAVMMTPVRYLSSADSIATGTVKWFDSKKGFGFISPDDGSDDVFVHQTAIHAEGFRSLADGEPVEYTTIADNAGRFKAENVTGPMGAFVQGAPRRQRIFETEDGFGTSRGFGRDGSDGKY